MYGQGAQNPQFKFNNLFNKHFPYLIFFKVFCRLNWRRIVIEKWHNGWLRLQTVLLPSRIYIGRGPPAL